jgi:glycolate oxidase iron-sulfur subunit
LQTQLAEFIRDTPLGQRADRILRSCVHCGFCNATCPTYQLLGDELDGPRGRIYLIKQMLEGSSVTHRTQLHLDRCLTCLNCQTTCPSGVEYGHLLDIGRSLLEERVQRPRPQRWVRTWLRRVLPYPNRFKTLLRIGQVLRPLLPSDLKRKIPAYTSPTHAWPTRDRPRKMLMLEGCVQPALSPNINIAAARALDALGIATVRAQSAGCCGAVSHHLGASSAALTFMKRNIDAWWPHIEAGAEAVLMTASGCGAVVKEYGEHLRNDPQYSNKAARVSELTRDLSEVMANEPLSGLIRAPRNHRVAFHAPCTLQHGQKLGGVVEKILTQVGFELVPITDAHLCCGSAGTYSILQRKLSQQLLQNKLKNLQGNKPELIATANIGCQIHLQSGSRQRVVHWIELIAERL